MPSQSWLVIGAGAAGAIHVRELMARGHTVAVADSDATRAQGLRALVIGLIGQNLADIRPGSPEAMRLKALLQAYHSGLSEICLFEYGK